MSDDWIEIPNWDRFQHYRDRRPVWIKLYTELQHKDEWRNLTLSERGLLASLWLEYALAGGTGLTSRRLSGRIGAPLRRHLDPLQEAGFVVVSASPRARPRARGEVEKEKAFREAVENPSFPIPELLRSLPA